MCEKIWQARKNILILAVALMCLLTGCTGQPPQTDVQMGTKSVLPQAFYSDPAYWLQNALENKEVVQEELSCSEVELLNIMADLTWLLPVYLHPKELSKEEILTPLFLYHLDTPEYHAASKQNQIREREYPAYALREGEMGYDVVCIQSEEADRLTKDVLGVGIPWLEECVPFLDNGAYCVYYEDSYFKVPITDYETYTSVLEAYQYLGDEIFYVSFAADSTGLPGPEEEWGTIQNKLQLLVRRSDSPGGFTVISKLKEGDDTLLPEEFPVPSQVMEYEEEKQVSEGAQ